MWLRINNVHEYEIAYDNYTEVRRAHEMQK